MWTAQKGGINVDKILIFFGDADKKYADVLYDFVGGFVCSEDYFKANPMQANTYFKIGGTWVPDGNVINLSGADRKETAVNVLNYISTH
jgi:hypothetical protein